MKYLGHAVKIYTGRNGGHYCRVSGPAVGGLYAPAWGGGAFAALLGACRWIKAARKGGAMNPPQYDASGECVA